MYRLLKCRYILELGILGTFLLGCNSDLNNQVSYILQDTCEIREYKSADGKIILNLKLNHGDELYKYKKMLLSKMKSKNVHSSIENLSSEYVLIDNNNIEIASLGRDDENEKWILKTKGEVPKSIEVQVDTLTQQWLLYDRLWSSYTVQYQSCINESNIDRCSQEQFVLRWNESMTKGIKCHRDQVNSRKVFILLGKDKRQDWTVSAPCEVFGKRAAEWFRSQNPIRQDSLGLPLAFMMHVNIK